jgi:NADPH:quinone reductase-like Zn-dependent oxidoreductase
VIQLAKMHNAKVTAVDSAEKQEFLRSLGADQVLDYRKEDFTKTDQKYDLVIDVVANRSLRAYKRSLAENGVYLMIGGKVSTIIKAALLGSLVTRKGNKKIKLLAHKPNKNLDEFNKLYEKGKVKPVIDKVLPLEKVQEALQLIGEGKVKGKVVIKVGS